MKRKITLVVELPDSKPGAMFEMLINLDEDLKAMQAAGILSDYGFKLADAHNWIVKLDEDEE